MLTDNMYQERMEEDDLPDLKTVLSYQYNDSRTKYKNTKEDWLQPSKRYWQHDDQQNDNN